MTKPVFIEKWLYTSSASAIVHVHGYDQTLLNDKVCHVGIIILVLVGHTDMTTLVLVCMHGRQYYGCKHIL